MPKKPLKNKTELSMFFVIGKDGKPKRVEMMEWAKGLNQRKPGTGMGNNVLRTEFKNKRKENVILISTIFLGMDHSFSLGTKPVLWETMIFCKSALVKTKLRDLGIFRYDDYQERYDSQAKAIKEHKQIADIIKKHFPQYLFSQIGC